ncbi:putative nucleic acid-binding OB-fold protein [Elusimicrobium simillimum]|uniref:hypothetical protein n=1 Tax=Elusimicrobium simillimum TaxID=3143438 RepID=UPI003C704C10
MNYYEEIINKKQEKRNAMFKVGDRVKSTRPRGTSAIGTVVEIISDSAVRVKWDGNSGVPLSHGLGELKKVKENSKNYYEQIIENKKEKKNDGYNDIKSFLKSLLTETSDITQITQALKKKFSYASFSEGDVRILIREAK